MQVWVLGALEVSLTAASQILFSLSAGAASTVWHLSSQDPSTYPHGPFTIDYQTRCSLYHAVDSIWISHAFALVFIVLCYVRGRINGVSRQKSPNLPSLQSLPSIVLTTQTTCKSATYRRPCRMPTARRPVRDPCRSLRASPSWR